jgi:glycosyltransferase involved in cell wall biosynthesis
VREATWRLSLDPRVLRSIRSELSGAHVVHAHDAHALRLAGWAVRTRRPIVASRRVAIPLRRTGWWGRATRVLAVSEAVRQQLLADGLSPARVLTIPSAVDAAAVRAAATAGARRRYALPLEGPLVVVPAALTAEKGHGTALEAARLLAADLPALSWAMAGDGPGRPQLETRIAALGLGSTVRLLGQVDDVPSLLREATVAVLPSLSEGLGTAALEAMAVGVPVVGSAVGGLAELLSGGAGIAVPPRDAAALAGAIRRVVTEPTVAAQLVDRSQVTLVAHEPARMARAVLDVYASVTGTGDEQR